VKDINLILGNVNHIFADITEPEPGERVDKYSTEYFTVGSDDELKQLLDTEYSVAYNKYLNGKGMFRGVHDRIKKQIGKYCILKPGNRTAFFTKNNLYTRLFSGILPSWREYPPRNKCFICTSSTGKALSLAGSSYRNDELYKLYVVLPKNNASICVCPRSTIQLAFPRIQELGEGSIKFRRLNEFQDAFMEFIRFISLTMYELCVYETQKNTGKVPKRCIELAALHRALKDALKYGSNANIVALLTILSSNLRKYYNKIIDIIETNDPIIKNYNFSATDRRNVLLFLKELKEHNTINLLEYLDNILNSKLNGFELTSIENYNIKSIITNKASDTGHELWTDAECLFVKIKYLESINSSEVEVNIE